jgi:hypothetical protein
MFSVPPLCASAWSWRTTDHAESIVVPSNSSTISPVPPPVLSGSKRIQSNDATGFVVVGSSPESATGPIFGSVNVLSEPGWPTDVNWLPSNE